MSAADCTELISAHGIRPTANRILIAEALSEAGRPVSLTELESLTDTIDKSGIFRTLTLFKEHHLVHTIEDGEAVRYELCRSRDHHHDNDVHPHFFCERCHRTFCLDGSAIPAIALPDGFEAESVNYLVKGICPDCR